MAGTAFDEKVTTAAWHAKPSWDVITGADHMILPQLQEAMAKRMGARIVRINASHVVMVSQPERIANAIIAAAEAVR